MKNLFKLILVAVFIILYSGCSTKEYKLGSAYENNTINPINVLFKDKNNICKSNGINVNINITYSDNFNIPVEYIPSIGFGSNYSWNESKYNGNFKTDFENIVKKTLQELCNYTFDSNKSSKTINSWNESKYNGNFKTDFENIVKKTLQELCNYTFDSNKSSKTINININDFKVSTENLNIKDNYIIPIIGIWRLEYTYNKNYLYDVKFNGNYFNKEINKLKKFIYTNKVNFYRNFLVIGNKNEINFKLENNDIFYYNGGSESIMPLNDYGLHTIKMSTFDEQLIYKENVATSGHAFESSDGFKNTINGYLSELFFINAHTFSEFPRIPPLYTGPITYLVYDIINEIIKNQKK